MNKDIVLKDRFILKQEAKQTINSNTRQAVAITFWQMIIKFVAFVVVFILAFKSAMSATSTIATDGVIRSIQQLIAIFSAITTTGISFTFLDWFRKKDSKFDSFKSLFTIFTKKYFTGSILIGLIRSIFTFLWTLLLIIPGIVKALSYSQAQLIFKDKADAGEKDISYMGCITESRQMMRGHKGDLLLLWFSFFGWFILGIITLGIGFLWILPYYRMTMIAFYDNLKQLNSESVDNFKVENLVSD